MSRRLWTPDSDARLYHHSRRVELDAIARIDQADTLTGVVGAFVAAMWVIMWHRLAGV
jgi:hypothetical protein